MRNIFKELLIKGFLSSEQLFKILRAFLYDDRILDKVLSDEQLANRLIKDDRLLQKILHDDQALPKLLSDVFLFERILADAQLLPKLLEDERSRHLILTNDRLLERLLRDTRTVDRIMSDVQVNPDHPFLRGLAAAIEFERVWQSLSHVLPTTHPAIQQKYRLALQKAAAGDAGVKNLILDTITEEDQLGLAGGALRFPDRRSLWILLHEILINEDYYFETEAEAPRILDGGTHFGLAIYYFKMLYPAARITGFEPAPALRALALENVKTNNYTNVDILPYALAGTARTAKFILSETDSMAGSLTARQRIAGNPVSEIEVECRPLSEFLREPVHFLKLDIEGVEDEVLAEAEPYLNNVQYIFCEYHHGNGLETDRLAKILCLLDRAGFDAQVGKSFSFQQRTNRRPLTFVERPYSAVIWARNRQWRPD